MRIIDSEMPTYIFAEELEFKFVNSIDITDIDTYYNIKKKNDSRIVNIAQEISHDPCFACFHITFENASEALKEINSVCAQYENGKTPHDKWDIDIKLGYSSDDVVTIMVTPPFSGFDFVSESELAEKYDENEHVGVIKCPDMYLLVYKEEDCKDILQAWEDIKVLTNKLNSNPNISR